MSRCLFPAFEAQESHVGGPKPALKHSNPTLCRIAAHPPLKVFRLHPADNFICFAVSQRGRHTQCHNMPRYALRQGTYAVMQGPQDMLAAPFLQCAEGVYTTAQGPRDVRPAQVPGGPRRPGDGRRRAGRRGPGLHLRRQGRRRAVGHVRPRLRHPQGAARQPV